MEKCKVNLVAQMNILLSLDSLDWFPHPTPKKVCVCVLFMQ